MIDHPEIFLHRLRLICAGILLVANVLLISFLVNPPETNRVEAKGKSPSSLALEMSDSPNVVTSGAAVAVDGIGQAMSSVSYAFSSGAKSTASVTARSTKSIVSGAKSGLTTASRGLGNALSTVGNAVGSGAVAVLSVPGNIISSVSETPVVRGFIRPSDRVEVPIIDPNSPELRAALEAMPATKKPGQKSIPGVQGPAWPIRGQVTTLFGVPHWPYQQTHSGLDISDMKPSGVTPIKPFRPGRVVETVHSAYGLGNHVIVDHGRGVTSVYAHLASISVRTGQEVGMNTTLGHEGSTGASTGTHLHFEIRVNGQAADPRQFISGQP